MPASFWVLQPQLMHDYLEHEACSYPTGCASMSGAYLMRQPAYQWGNQGVSHHPKWVCLVLSYQPLAVFAVRMPVISPRWCEGVT
jgi:hypothetical protein